MTHPTTAVATSTYETRPDCPAHYHDTYAAYQRAGCRCTAAREDWRLYYKRQREGRAPTRRVHACGSQRRIQALMALGHTTATIGASVDKSAYEIQQIARNRKWVSPATAQTIRLAYQRLSATPGTSDVTRKRAGWWGYAPPLAWEYVDIDDPAAQPDLDGDPQIVVDDLLVRRAVDGDDDAVAGLNRAERVEATRRLLRRDLNAGGISRRLRVSGATANRLVAQAREAAA